MLINKTTAAALALALAATASFNAQADDVAYGINLSGSTNAGFSAGLSPLTGASVNHQVSGAFTDTFTFTGYSGASIVDVWLDTSVSFGNEATQQIVFTSATLNGIALTIDPAETFNKTVFRTAELVQQSTSGPLVLVVTGYAGLLDDVSRQISASYSGGINVAVSPVPEPAPYAMLLAGLGAVGFIARRRTR
ncbi:FxDxF family PEP-CTERM protein [Burkholderiaceae bacterium UC74_6]